MMPVTFRFLALFLLTTAVAVASIAQEHPVVQAGFAADKVYNIHGLDSVNTFNGNLNLAIPLGLRYPVNGGFSYGLTLSYNSKVWSYVEVTNICGPTPPPSCVSPVTRAEPSHRSNAGLGWVLSMGRIVPPENPMATDPNGGYQTADGATHAFYDALHPAIDHVPIINPPVMYSRDDTYFRKVSTPTGSKIQHPDGTTHAFNLDGELVSIADPFGNSVSVRTINDPFELAGLSACSTGGLYRLTSAWQITDIEARQHYVCFTDTPRYPKNIYNNQLVKRVVLQSPGNQTAVYEFHYVIPVDAVGNVGVRRGCHSNLRNDDLYPDVPVLQSLDLPDGSHLEATYVLDGGENCSQGALSSLTLPTGGKIEYTYRYYQLPAKSCDRYQWTAFSTGVGTRRMVDGITNPTWTYTTEYGPLPGGMHDCGSNEFGIISRNNPWETFATSVVMPDGAVQKQWYSVWPYADASPNGYTYKEFGLPLKRHEVRDDAFLSSQTIGADGIPLRSSYVRFEYDSVQCTGYDSDTYGLFGACLDANRRVVREQTVYHDDSDRIVRAEYSGFDGFGHHRTAKKTSSIPGTPERTSFTNYAPDETRWLLGKFTDSWMKQGSGSSATATKTIAVFDDTLGVMKSLRRLRATGSDPNLLQTSPNDLMTAWCRDGRGFVTSERSFGGDAASVPTGDPCLESWTAGRYFLNHAYSADPSSWNLTHTAQYSGLTDLIVDEDWDWSTRLVLRSRDSAGVPTDYQYDEGGRLKGVRPTGRAWEEYEYSPTSNPPMIAIRQCLSGTSNCTATALTESRHYFDPFGRLKEQRRRTSATAWAATWLTYDALGRKRTSSVPVAASSGVSGDQPAGTALTSWDYDALGRVTRETRPDASSTDYAYVGDRLKTRTSGVWTGIDGDSQTAGTQDSRVSVTEEYDGSGRLLSVAEKSGPTNAAAPIGALVTTEYEYDLADRLTSVTMNRSTAGPVQYRFFDYDGRGFLRWESQPESGMTLYQYDARGNVVSKTQGAANTQFDLKFVYDLAGRLTRVDGRNPLYPQDPGEPEFRVMKEFAYGAANTTLDAGTSTQRYDLRKGKLTTASRYNYLGLLNNATHKISDRYEYTDTAGRRTGKVTTFFAGQLNARDVSVFTAYDDLDLPVTLKYPMCEGCGFPPQAVDRESETRTYDRGRLKSVTGFADAITYWPNGMRKLLPHINGVYDQQEVGAMARPTQIKFGKYDRCVQPTFALQPGGGTRPLNGPPITLTANATGTAPILYEWDGPGGPIPSNVGDPKSITVSPTVTSEYLVWATNECGQTPSQIAKVTVTGCELPSTGTITAVTQPDGSWVLTPDPTARQPRSYQWKRLSDNANLGTEETQAVGALSQTTTFSLTISDACGSTTSNVTIVVSPPMSTTGLVATANASYTQVTVAWPAVTGATSYSVQRRSGGDWVQVATPISNSFVDTQVIGSTTYAYRAAIGANYSNVDVATTMAFPPPTTGESITTGTAEQMLTAVNKVRAAAGWPAVTWATILSPSDPVVAVNNVITSRQLLACRARLNEARQALGAAGVGYTDADVMQSGIKALHIREVLEAVQ